MKKNFKNLILFFTLIATIVFTLGNMSVYAAPDPMKDAARELMLEMMGIYKGAYFDSVAHYGDESIYKNALDAANVKYNPKLEALAEYDPGTNTLSFSFDPSAVIKTATPADRKAYGEKIYHEVTHKIEDIHKDTGIFQSKAYKERNIEYMFNVYQLAFPKLKMLEDAAIKGAPDSKLQEIWDAFLRDLENAKKLPETLAYPPDATLLKSWFGFEVSPDALINHYISTGEPKRLKEFFAAKSWSGSWQDLALGKVELKQVGNSVTGTYVDSSGNKGTIEGTVTGPNLKANLRRTYYYLYPELSEAELEAKFPEYFGTLEVVLSKDGLRFNGEIKTSAGTHLYSSMASRKTP